MGGKSEDSCRESGFLGVSVEVRADGPNKSEHELELRTRPSNRFAGRATGLGGREQPGEAKGEITPDWEMVLPPISATRAFLRDGFNEASSE